MKKLLFVVVFSALLFLVACADSNNDRAVNVTNNNCEDDLLYVTHADSENEILTIYSHSDEIIFESMDEMLSFVEDLGMFRVEIVRVEVIDERVELYDEASVFQHEDATRQYDSSEWDDFDSYNPYTFHRVRVLEVFQGDVLEGDVLDVMQRGGQIDNVRLVCSSFIELLPGDDLILFLSSPIWMPNSPAGIISSTQATYRFPAVSEGTRSVSFDEVLEPVHQFPDNMAEYAFPLTIEDLVNFQLENFGQVSDSFDAILR